ncbi:Insertion element 4 transposase N-terminal [Streptomyces sp. DconLS]|nr:Insertion element 4 transposase N-terminal [Streptomyces sp. DconLS]SCG03160.1 Insertion element 4 transposase N-terminal [Streptomyces sp. DconLS]
MKSSGVGRFSDRIALGVLTRVFPPELVDEVVAECGRVEQRTRLLPARVVVYFVLAMCLNLPLDHGHLETGTLRFQRK